jgi:ABC-type nitrate/sulfonate/bicarbonate transport system substrate-binding protein
MFKNKSIIAIASIIILGIVGILVFQSSSKPKSNSVATVTSQTSSIPTKKVKIAYLPLSSTIQLFVAKEKGYFQKYGVDIELAELATSNQTAEGVQSGDFDLNFYTTSVAGLNAYNKDPGKFLIYSSPNNNQGKEWDGVFSKSNSSITKVEELAGKKIGVFPGTTGTAYIKDFLKSKNVDISKTEFVQLPPTQQKPALDSGSIDALFAYEPTTTILSKSTDYRKISGTILYSVPNAAVGITTINKKFTQEYPQLASNVVKAIDEGIEFVRKKEQESRQTLTKYIKIDPVIANDIVILDSSKSTELQPQKLQEYFDYLLSIGELKQKVDAKSLVYAQTN